MRKRKHPKGAAARPQAASGDGAPRPSRKARRIVQARRRARALEMRVAGASLAEIGAELGVSVSGASKLITRAVRRLDRPGAEQVRAIERERLDVATRGLMDRVARGLPKAIGAFVRVAERRARLDGLDAPSRTESRVELRDGPTFPDSPAEQIPILEAMLEEARRRVAEGA